MSDKTVLIVDDEVSIRDMLERMLEFAEYQTCTASSGSEGLQKLQDREPDLVISDVLMPGMDGHEFCQRIRQISDVPIMMLSGQVNLEDEQEKVRTQSLGINAVMTKPLRMTEFLDTVERPHETLNRSR